MITFHNHKYSVYTGDDADPCLFMDSMAQDAFVLARTTQTDILILKSSGIMIIKLAENYGDILYYVAKKDLIFRAWYCHKKKHWKNPPCIIVNPSWLTYWRHRFAIKFSVQHRINQMKKLWPIGIHTTKESYDFRDTDLEKEVLNRLREKFAFDTNHGVYSMTMDQMFEKGKRNV